MSVGTQKLKTLMKTIKAAVDTSNGDYGDEIVEAMEMNTDEFRVWLDEKGIDGEMGRAEMHSAHAYLNAIADERDMTIHELIEDEDLL